MATTQKYFQLLAHESLVHMHIDGAQLVLRIAHKDHAARSQMGSSGIPRAYDGLTRPQDVEDATMEKILDLVFVITARAYTRWALSEIDPLHPDVPKLVLRRQQLEDRARRLFGRTPLH